MKLQKESSNKVKTISLRCGKTRLIKSSNLLSALRNRVVVTPRSHKPIRWVQFPFPQGEYNE